MSLLAVQVAFLATQTNLEEGWEISANRRQPPDKVMDAAGVKPGMVIIVSENGINGLRTGFSPDNAMSGRMI